MLSEAILKLQWILQMSAILPFRVVGGGKNNLLYLSVTFA